MITLKLRMLGNVIMTQYIGFFWKLGVPNLLLGRQSAIPQWICCSVYDNLDLINNSAYTIFNFVGTPKHSDLKKETRSKTKDQKLIGPLGKDLAVNSDSNNKRLL
ncbi:unnamed protein product [Chrysodeixis includens]|uniref:Uncharacterized protein n=1 Tax=Chrysodeixis includens TaxID=689277 RepID=A0A9P0FYR7_CHRIL|nr:unnamed protein product [Chrysodeixis includens]